ncbi:hypothetical protein VB779_14465 [Haloarculaceae archaeon H-GB11]|nr:hypothetical protein [Haloarculaceae archaeon H-GB11]
MSRAQVSLSALEGAVGVVLVLTVAMGFTLGVPNPDGRAVQLEAYAEDTATLLANEPPQHGGNTRLDEIVATEASFRRERSTLRNRVDRILPANVFFRVVTPHGAIGRHEPAGVAVGSATVPTTAGTVEIRVWYA